MNKNKRTVSTMDSQYDPSQSYRNNKLVKIKDLQECNQNNSVDIIAIIAKVGELKLTCQQSKGAAVAAREIYIYDDSWAIVKLIVRDNYARSSGKYNSKQILYLKNIMPMKLRNYVVLATIKDTVLTLEIDSSEVVGLKSWFTQNYEKLQDEGYRLFLNLSVAAEKNPTEYLSAEHLTANNSDANVDVEKNKNTTAEQNIENVDYTGEQRKLQISDGEQEHNISYVQELNGEPCLKVMRMNSTIAAHSKFHFDINQQNLQKFQDNQLILENKNGIPSESFHEIIKIDSDDDQTMEKKYIKMENQNDESVNMDFNSDISTETFQLLMNKALLEEWNEYKDKHLVNFLLKNFTDFHSISIYDNILNKKPQIFQGMSLEMLKHRTENLASVKNYLYFMKLCGGENIKTEEEKCIFIAKIEKLRKLIHLMSKNNIND